jgi:hypothetical protein
MQYIEKFSLSQLNMCSYSSEHEHVNVYNKHAKFNKKG